MQRLNYIWRIFWIIFLASGTLQAQDQTALQFDFYGETVRFPINQGIHFSYPAKLDIPALSAFFEQLESKDDGGLVAELIIYRKKRQLDDWLYYQLIRKTAQQISPKEENYYRYTLYKWYLLSRSGYQTTLTWNEDKLLFYVRSDETVYNIPTRTQDGRQFVCLNYHDYNGRIDFSRQQFREIPLYFNGAINAFTYRVNSLPEIKGNHYNEKDLSFRYLDNDFHFRIRFNPEVQQLFRNYPVVDYEYFFNRPMSRETYSSLIPELKKQLKGMNARNGVDFLMRFSRYAFLFEPDMHVYGTEKRMSPEETLLNSQSDCEDRAALFFYLVKEIYNLPMLVLSYPKHLTIAVGFDKPFGNTVEYKGRRYTICEPTPQKTDLRMGEMLPELRKLQYMVAYNYNPLEP